MRAVWSSEAEASRTLSGHQATSEIPYSCPLSTVESHLILRELVPPVIRLFLHTRTVLSLAANGDHQVISVSWDNLYKGDTYNMMPINRSRRRMIKLWRAPHVPGDTLRSDTEESLPPCYALCVLQNVINWLWVGGSIDKAIRQGEYEDTSIQKLNPAHFTKGEAKQRRYKLKLDVYSIFSFLSFLPQNKRTNKQKWV